MFGVDWPGAADMVCALSETVYGRLATIYCNNEPAIQLLEIACQWHFSMIRRVQFAENDMAGVMHFANYFPDDGRDRARVLPQRRAEHRDAMGGEKRSAGPAYQLVVRYYGPVRFEDELELRLEVSGSETSP